MNHLPRPAGVITDLACVALGMLALAPALAHGACALAASTPSVSFPRQQAQALPLVSAGSAQYRRVGIRTVNVAGVCTGERRQALHLRVRGVDAGPDGLFRWGSHGVLVLTALAFNVNGVTVPMRLEHMASDAWFPSLVVQPNQLIVADASRAATGERYTFSMVLQIEARVPADRSVPGAERVTDNVQVDVVEK